MQNKKSMNEGIMLLIQWLWYNRKTIKYSR